MVHRDPPECNIDTPVYTRGNLWNCFDDKDDFWRSNNELDSFFRSIPSMWLRNDLEMKCRLEMSSDLLLAMLL